MANGDVIRCSIQGYDSGANSTTVNTWHYVDRSGGSHSFDASTGASDFWSFMGGFLCACLGTTWTANAVRFAIGAGPGIGKVGEFFPTTSNTGGNSFTDACPPEICISLKRWTGYASRSNRGRLFIGPTDAMFFIGIQYGAVDTTNASLIALSNAMKATFTTGTVGCTPVLVNKLWVPTAAPISYNAIAEQSVHRKTRRNPGLPV